MSAIFLVSFLRAVFRLFVVVNSDGQRCCTQEGTLTEPLLLREPLSPYISDESLQNIKGRQGLPVAYGVAADTGLSTSIIIRGASTASLPNG